MVMKRPVLGLCLALVLFVPSVQAEVLEVILTLGDMSSYTASTKTLEWSQGAMASVVYSDAPSATYFDVTVTGIFSGAVDTSSGGVASAYYPIDDWSLDIKDNSGNDVLYMDGDLADGWNYYEEEQSTDYIHGWTVAHVHNLDLGAGLTWDVSKFEWTIGITSDNYLPLGTDITDYQSDWSTNNVTITFWGDEENAVPEPATIMLFGLGGLALIRKRSV
jgi:hypothetical protein